MKWLSGILFLLICAGYIVLAIELKNINPKHFGLVFASILFSLLAMGKLIKNNPLFRKRKPFQIFN
jgi:hypothetical protein